MALENSIIALLNNMTIVGNTAGGIHNRATATMQNTIMAKNPTLSAPDCDTNWEIDDSAKGIGSGYKIVVVCNNAVAPTRLPYGYRQRAVRTFCSRLRALARSSRLCRASCLECSLSFCFCETS